MGDFPTLRRLLWILLDNALKYTPAPGCIDVALKASATEARVLVSDSGIGISQADLPHIFDRFYRADPIPQPGGGQRAGVGDCQGHCRDARGRSFRSQQRRGRNHLPNRAPRLQPGSRSMLSSRAEGEHDAAAVTETNPGGRFASGWGKTGETQNRRDRFVFRLRLRVLSFSAAKQWYNSANLASARIGGDGQNHASRYHQRQDTGGQAGRAPDRRHQPLRRGIPAGLLPPPARADPNLRHLHGGG